MSLYTLCVRMWPSCRTTIFRSSAQNQNAHIALQVRTRGKSTSCNITRAKSTRRRECLGGHSGAVWRLSGALSLELGWSKKWDDPCKHFSILKFSIPGSKRKVSLYFKVHQFNSSITLKPSPTEKHTAGVSLERFRSKS